LRRHAAAARAGRTCNPTPTPRYPSPCGTDRAPSPLSSQDIREGSNMIFELKRSSPIAREPSEEDLACKEKTDCFKLAGAIAGRVRDNEEARRARLGRTGRG
jgi:hypothetical protein